MTYQNPKATYACINYGEAYAPRKIAERSVCIDGDIGEVFYKQNLTEDERTIYKILSKTMRKSMSEIAPYVAFGKSKTTQLLKEMEKKGVVKIKGRGRGTKYVINGH